MKRKTRRQSVSTACLGVALATAWGVGQADGASVVGDDFKFTGTISPVASDLSNLYLLYGSGYSASLSFFDSLSLGSVSAGNSLPFLETAFVESGDSNGLIIIGTYGNTAGGFNDSVNGVSIIMDSSYGAGAPPLYQQPGYTNWTDYFSTPEADVFGALVAGNTVALEGFFGSEIYTRYDQQFYDAGAPLTENRIILNFSDVTDGGSASTTTQVIPEGSTSVLALLGMMALACPRRRRA